MWNGRKYLQIIHQIVANIQNIQILIQLNTSNYNNLIFKIGRQIQYKIFLRRHKMANRYMKVCQSSLVIRSFQISHSLVSDSLQPHKLQHTRPPCPSPTPTVHPNSCPLSQWYHPAISSSVFPFSSCPQSLQHQGLFQLFT